MNDFVLTGKCRSVYELIKKEGLSDILSTGYLFRHIKSGARVAVISNDDDNKVFSIGFRTPPGDSTGVAHITEHSVLCGSRKYPLKDPFVELCKGSLNTFLNAMTYPDKTVYPVASCNDKDFANLMSVYMDAVFYPDTYDKKEIFEQEGWHYEMEDIDSPITINGVVYNEMRGVFSSPEQQLARMIQNSLFPDNTYGNESGGDPDNIPELSYEDFLAFHKRYYHPSNSYIYLYGDMDIEEKLLWMDRYYLRFFDKEDVDSGIALQDSFDGIRYVDGVYSAQNEDDKAYFSYNCVIDTSLNIELQMAMQTLLYSLVIVQGSPVRQALLDAGIAEDVGAMLDTDICQPVLTIYANEADVNRKDDFVRIIRETLERVCREGVDKKSLLASLTRSEFKYREADFGRYPKGLMFGLQAMETWLYDDNMPFDMLCLNDVYKSVKELVSTDYYENLIKEYILDNRHASVVCIYPEIGLSTKKDEALAAKLSEYRASLDEGQLKAIVDGTKKLRVFQETPDSPEALKSVPLLNRQDIDPGIKKIYLDKKEISGVTVLHHNMFTNGIAYICLAFDVTEYEEYAPYIMLLSLMLGSVDTVNYSYMELSNEINLATGGMSTDVNVIPAKNDTDSYKIIYELSARVLYTSMGRLFEIVEEIIKGSLFNDKKRLKEILLEMRADLKGSLEAAGNATALERGLSYISKAQFCKNQLNGVLFYRFLSAVCDKYDDYADELIRILEALLYKVFRKDNLTVSITADDEGYNIFADKSYDLFGTLYPVNEDAIPALLPVYKPVMGVWNEGYKTPGKVQYVARTGNFIKKGYGYSGRLKVLKTILSYGYLWENIRIKGGAYGAMCGFTRTGNAYLVSYRDPNLADTNRVYEALPGYLESFDTDEREMTKYIIGTMSEVDAPLTPRSKGRTAYNMYMSGVDRFDLQKERDEILSMTAEDVRACADIIRAVLDCGCICVVGSKAAIEENRDMFGLVEKLN